MCFLVQKATLHTGSCRTKAWSFRGVVFRCGDATFWRLDNCTLELQKPPFSGDRYMASCSGDYQPTGMKRTSHCALHLRARAST